MNGLLLLLLLHHTTPDLLLATFGYIHSSVYQTHSRDINDIVVNREPTTDGRQTFIHPAVCTQHGTMYKKKKRGKGKA